MADLRELLRLYASTNDCPVCFAVPKMVDQKIERWPNSGNMTVSGGRWHVEHGLSCDVRRALVEGGEGDG